MDIPYNAADKEKKDPLYFTIRSDLFEDENP